VIPWIVPKAKLTLVLGGQKIDDLHTRAWAKPVLKRLLGTDIIQRVPNVWWLRLLALQGIAFIGIFVVAEQVALSGGWRIPWQTVTWNGLPSMPGWFYDLIYSRSNNSPNGAHLLSYVGIPLIGLVAMWKTKDLFMGLLMGAFYVAIHEGPWEAVYYIAYYQYLGWADLTNVFEDAAFAVMMVLFIVTFWKYPYRKISMKEFAPVVYVYLGMLGAWAVVPEFFGYGILPITTINNHTYGKGSYFETVYWPNPAINMIEVFSWFALFLMMLYVVITWKKKD
jgi:hypothetical protein